MFGRLKNRGVNLAFAGHFLRAANIPEFEALLSPLTAVSAPRLAELATLDGEALRYTDQTLGQLITQFSSSLNTPAEIAELAKRVQTLGANYQPWSDALSQASQWQDHQNPFRQALINACMHYLSNEQLCIQTLQDNRRQHQPAHADDQQHHDERRQRLIFAPHTLGIGAEDRNETALTRLGKGHVAEMTLQPGQSATLMFARHVFLVVCGNPWLLIDDHGEDLQLLPGRNLVGRSTDCDVVVDERYFAVSRRHTLLETNSENVLKITDLSSLGTFIPQAGGENRFH